MDGNLTESSNPTQSRELELFCAALDRPADERSAFLDGACHGAPSLRKRLDALLAAHEQPATELGETSESTLKDNEGIRDLDEAVGQTLGRYKLLEKVGEGGCGVVYVAEQTEPVRRRVALKVIKLGMDTKQVVARFEAERQALAMMDHPNIAKVLDAGTTDVGRPFFVMELVRGIRITDYCDQANLSTKERLDLFIKVCHAIQHAHQKGIIHRDIKPSNILVTLHDGVPVPKVIDFGIAKATEGRLTDATVYTQLHQFVGTPAYMSPEQAEMSGLDIDTRSDIYSLGVLLYELLAGSTPFDPKELMASGLDAMRKTIREEEPQRPSTRLATLGADQLTTTARRRSADTSKLLHQLKGDLDWIVMKCLEKDRSRRYDTANGLAADITRHLSNEPVIARPPSAAYKFQKAWRRNKVVYTAATLVVLAVVTGLALATHGFWRTTRAQKQALQESLRADEVAASMIEMLNTTIPELYYRGNLKQGEVIMQRADALAHSLSNAPAAELNIRWSLKIYYDELFNDFKEAKTQTDRIMVLLPQVTDGLLPSGVSRMAIEEENPGHLLWNSDDPRHHQEGRRLLELKFQKAKEFPLDDAAARARAIVGAWDLNMGDYETALPLLEEALEYLPPEPCSMAHYWVRLDLAATLLSLGETNRACDLLLKHLSLPKDNAPVTQIFLLRGVEAGVRLLTKFGRSQEYEQGVRELEKGLRELRYPKQVLDYLRALRGLSLMEGDAARQKEGRRLIDEAADEEEAACATWRIATTVAAGLDDPGRYGQLKRRGIRSFTSGADVAQMIELTWLVLLRDPSEFEIGLCRDLVTELEQRFQGQTHHSALRLPALRALLAYRQNDYRGSLAEAAKLAPVRKDIPIVARRLKEDRETDRWVVRALAYSALGQTHEAERALQNGHKAMETEIPRTPGLHLSFAILAREAERAIASKSGTQKPSLSP